MQKAILQTKHVTRLQGAKLDASKKKRERAEALIERILNLKCFLPVCRL